MSYLVAQSSALKRADASDASTASLHRTDEAGEGRRAGHWIHLDGAGFANRTASIAAFGCTDATLIVD